MSEKPTDPRERAARALCTFHGNTEDAILEDRPMWERYLPDVDVVLTAAVDAVTIINANDNSGRWK